MGNEDGKNEGANKPENFGMKMPETVMTKDPKEKLSVQELAEALYEGTPHLQNLAEKLARQHSGAGALCFYGQQYPEVKKFYEYIAAQLIEHAKQWKPHQSGGFELNAEEVTRLKNFLDERRTI